MSGALATGRRLSGATLALLLLTACAKVPEAPILMPGGGQKAVVFDIDGTLTPRNRDILLVRPDAVKVAQAFSDKGYRVIYLSARHTYVQMGLPQWLRRKGFPQGPLHAARSRADNANPLAFKERVLNAYRRQGWTLAYAYGDSSTDFTAYANAGIPQEHVFALRRKHEKSCQPGIFRECLDSYSVHLPFVMASVPSLK